MKQEQINDARDSLRLATQMLSAICNGIIGPIQNIINQAQADEQKRANTASTPTVED